MSKMKTKSGAKKRFKLTASGKIDGKHASECVLPSAFGLDAKTLEFGNRSRTASGAEKKQKT